MLTGSNKKNRHTLTAWLLKVVALVVVAALSAIGLAGAVFAEGDESSLTVNFSATSDILQDDDLKENELVVELYKVAEGVMNDNSDTYKITVTTDFSDLKDAVEKAQVKVEDGSEDEDNTTQWKAVAQSAADLVKNGDVVEKPLTGTVGEAITAIKPGLYLVLTHNTLEDLRAEDSSLDTYFATEEDGKISTIALTSGFEYHFEPQIIFLPAKNHDDETGIIPADTFAPSADWGEWVHDASIILKPAQTGRFGSIRVEKQLTGKDSHYKATFVFDVEATKIENGRETNVYSNVFTLNFDSTGTTGFNVDKIPVGSSVTVTEVYSGSSYELVDPLSGYITKTVTNSNDVVNFTFINQPTDGPGGYGILNTFTSDGEHDWIWNPVYDRDSSAAALEE